MLKRQINCDNFYFLMRKDMFQKQEQAHLEIQNIILLIQNYQELTGVKICLKQLQINPLLIYNMITNQMIQKIYNSKIIYLILLQTLLDQNIMIIRKKHQRKLKEFVKKMDQFQL
ncbi:hypothetical protein IMG5_046670 [Ichthyophthirius multifiliis]|uniref:Uncharacterized protein n=1 Tax=Ichthyophthirius multifiliis TaxID=5932 RepID=G0QM92_ICHMU|nr:hypothetical protein IMG5_046670 [Ichthyophthirius multifiliis]EGR33668.1 hypothetical protein IMG5_046670 [Ichthyophthirius multifiliis]|eukprot:XP_004037654.1 hypothetical protein IMG5_046670 [Ichthyophthirius multifiliis]